MRPTLLSLFSGAGGLDHGLEAAGFDVRAAVDNEPDCCSTLRENNKWPVIEADTSRLSGQSLLEAGDVRRDEVDLLVGGPPCQPFSKASFWTNGEARGMSDPRARTLLDYMRLVEELRPKVFLLENVHGIAYSGNEAGFTFLQNRTRSINRRTGSQYALTWKVLDTADFGVPQHRSRFFLVGSREGASFRFPPPSHGPIRSEGKLQRTLVLKEHLDEYATAWDAIGHLEPDPGEDLSPKGYWRQLLPSIPEGKNYLWHTDHGGGLELFGWRTRYWSFLLKLAKSLPSWTIPAQPGPAIGPFHWLNRYLGVSELAALQTFPRGLKFVGGRVSVQRQLGNAVPSLMGEVLGRAIASTLLETPIRGPLKLAVPPRRPIPAPEPVLLVPHKYHHLVGKHAPHPGTRRGPGAVGRQLVQQEQAWLEERASQA